jgi:hypothetical protein
LGKRHHGIIESSANAVNDFILGAAILLGETKEIQIQIIHRETSSSGKAKQLQTRIRIADGFDRTQPPHLRFLFRKAHSEAKTLFAS